MQQFSPCRLPDCHLRPVLRIWTGSYRDRAETTHYILLHTLLRIVESLVSMFFQPVLQLPSLAWIPFHLYHSLTTFAVALHLWGLYFLDDLMVWPWYKREDHNCSIGPKCAAKNWIEGHGPVGFSFSPQKTKLCPRKNGHCPHFDRMVWPETWSVSNLFWPTFCWGFGTELGSVDRWW